MKEAIKESPFPDGRALDHQTLEAIRFRAVAAVERGYSPETVIDILGFSRSCIYSWLDRYRSQGWEGLRARPLSGRPPELDATAREWLKKTVLESTPQKWGYDTLLWTRAILVELIEQRFELRLSEVTVGRYLAALGLSPQVPEWKAHEQDPEEVRRFLEEKFPQIARLAVKTGAQILFIDETGCRANQHAGRTWGLRGQRPEVQSTGQRFGINVISAISPEGDLHFKALEHSIGSQDVIEFLENLLQETDRPLIILADGSSIHFSAAVRQFARPRRTQLKLFKLPAYSPECNPDEGVWSELKPHGLGRKGIQDKKDLKTKLYSTMHSLQKKTEKILSFFFRTPACVDVCGVLIASGYL